MTIEQTIEIPANRRITLEVPPEVPAGSAHITIVFPVREDKPMSSTVMPEAKGCIDNETFRNALCRAYGAWKEKPWTTHLDDVNAMRDEWGHRN